MANLTASDAQMLMYEAQSRLSIVTLALNSDKITDAFDSDELNGIMALVDDVKRLSSTVSNFLDSANFPG